MAKKAQRLEFDLNRLHELYNISLRSIRNCPIPEDELEKIYYDYQKRMAALERRRIEILATLNEGMTSDVHSIRSRIKDPDHLLCKIIRGCYSNPGKYQLITHENYTKIITDLIGIRIIILDRRDWKGIHQDLLNLYRNMPDRYVRRLSDILTNYDKYEQEVMSEKTVPGCAYHAERPIAYIASEDDRKLYKDEYLKLDNSKAHYRSVHYIVRYKDVYFEIQMRSLFEEGWLEFDHRMKYPNDRYNHRKEEYIGILSNLANAADQLISYYREEDFVSDASNNEDEDNYTQYEKKPLTKLGFEDHMKRLF